MSDAFCMSTLTDSWKRVSGGSAPVDSTEKMKWSLTRVRSTRSSHPGWRMHSRHMVQLRGRATVAVGTPARSSMSKTLVGHMPLSAVASSPVTGFGSVISGRSRYEAVHTGDHLACVLPMPFSHHASSSISWPGRILAIRMSSCTGAIGASRKRSSCSPCGIHSRSPEVTREPSSPASLDAPLPAVLGAHPTTAGPGLAPLLRCLVHLTCSRNEMTLYSLGSSGGSPRNWKTRASARIGMSPSRCASTSSWIIDVLLRMKTFSMAIVGTSASRMRRKALASAASMPIKSNTASSALSDWISTRKSRRKRSIENEFSRPLAA